MMWHKACSQVEPQWSHPSWYKMALSAHVRKLLQYRFLREDHLHVFWNIVPMNQHYFKEMDMMNVGEEHLTAKENQLLTEVRSDGQKHTDLVIDNGYTGAIKDEYLEAIIRSLKVSFVSRRCLYMKEFMLGLSSDYPKSTCLSAPLCHGDLKKDVTPSADYLFSFLEPHFLQEATSRRCFEEDIMDYFQDILSECETGNVVGHQTPVAFNYKEEIEETGDGGTDQDENEVFERPSVSVPGVMGWLTGSQHKPISGGNFEIAVNLTTTVSRTSQGTVFVFQL